MTEKLNKNKITTDWLNLFPDFAKYKTMHLIKRNGCFLSGLQFESLSSQRYRVCFHLYNLMVDVNIPTIPLVSATHLLNKKGAINSFSMEEHDSSLEVIVNELYSQVPLITKKILKNSDLITYMKGIRNIFYDKTTLTDIVLLNYYYGNHEQAESEIENGKRIIFDWPVRVTWDYGGAKGWEKEVRGLMNIEALNATIENQLQKFGLNKLTNFHIIT